MMAIVENGNGGGMGVDLGRTTPTPLGNPPPDSHHERRDHHRQGQGQGRTRHPDPTRIMSMMNPTQVLLPPDGARHAFFIDFVQSKGILQQQVQLQRQDKNLRAMVAENGGSDHGDGGGDERDIRELQELFSKLNPMAEEFVPPSLANGPTRRIYGNGSKNGNAFVGYNGGENGLLNGAALRRVCSYASDVSKHLDCKC